MRLDEIEQQLNKLKLDNKTSIEECDAGIAKADEQLELLNNELMDAQANTNAEKFAKVKSEINTAKYSKELFIEKKKRLETTPLITREEYKSLIKEIEGATDNLIDQQEEVGHKLIKQMHEVMVKENNYIDNANKLLRLLQFDVYKDADKKVFDTGNVFSIAVEYRHKDNFGNFYNYTIKDSWAEREAGVDKPASKFLG